MLFVNRLDIALKVMACYFGIVQSSAVVSSKENTLFLLVIEYMLEDDPHSTYSKIKLIEKYFSF